MIYGNNSGDYCVDQDLAWSGGSFHEQTSSCINNTNYRIRVYDDPPGSPRQLLWTMPPRYSVDYMLEASPTIQKLTSQFKEGTVGKHSSLSLRDRGPPTLCRSRCGIRAGTLNTTAGGI
jgi:hypothetical protein